MNQKRQYKAFKEEAVALVIDQGYTVPELIYLMFRSWFRFNYYQY
jgi:hypothetical protein